MKNISTVPGVDTGTTEKPYGVPLDDATPGDGSGMAIRQDHYSDLYYGLNSVMADVDITPDNSEEGVVTSQFRDAIIEMSIKYGQPIGTEIDWHPDLGGLTPALTALYSKYYVPSDGSIINSSDSVFHGYRAPNTNGANVVLTGVVWVSGVATIPATDVTALSIGDDVTGSGIAANTYISNIVGTTVTLTDTAISATIDTTFTNNGLFVRGGATSGVGKKDQMQLTEGSFEIRDGDSSGTRVPIISNFSGMATDGGDGVGGTNRISISGIGGIGKKIDLSNADSPNARTSSTTAGETHPHYNTRKKLFKIL